jgi:hypothetical protein
MGGSRSALQNIVLHLVGEHKSSENIVEVVAVEISSRFPGLSIGDNEALVMAVLDDCGVRAPNSSAHISKLHRPRG